MNETEDTFDKMSSPLDEGSLSSSTPPPAPIIKPADALVNAKKSIGRIRTAIGLWSWNWTDSIW